MDTREWIFVLGVVAVVIVALIAAARWQRRRFDEIRPGDVPSGDGEVDFGSDELPGGGARTIGYRAPTDIERMNEEIRARAEASRPKLSSFHPEPGQQSLLLEPEGAAQTDESSQESVPLLLDPSDEHNVNQGATKTGRVAGLESEGPEFSETQSEPADDMTEDVGHAALRTSEEAENPSIELRAQSEDRPAFPERQNRQEDVAAAEEEGQEPGELIIINLMNDVQHPYDGSKLLKVATELGLRYGDMNIFHYCGPQGDELPQFRMANLLKPGYFEIDAMDQTRTHALCFFFELQPGQENMRIYETMLSVISKIRDELGGELHDENRSVFTIQTSEHCRNRIRDFQRRHLRTR